MVKTDDCRSKTDAELVKATLKDENYFVCLVQRYQAQLLRYIRRISSISREDAEDILQEVFFKIYTNLNAFDQSLKFSSWVYRIAHNQTISSYRKVKVRPQEVSLESFDTNSFELLAHDLNIEREIDIKYLRDNIDKILAKLDIKYREALVLKFFEEKSYEEMSDILKKPKNTVGTLINRAKKQFVEIYKKDNHDR